VIQIEAIRIIELRGIRELKIKPKRKSFVISGGNGSGKSGVVDAISRQPVAYRVSPAREQLD
jgi:predicted ATP-binding protein involved in virulence